MYQLKQWEMYTETVAKEKMKELLGKIIQNYRKKEDDIVKEFLESISTLLQKYKIAQQSEKKGELKSIQFCFLNLSVLMGEFEIHIEAFDKYLYLNRNEVNGVWKADFVYQYYSEYTAFLIKKCEQNVKDFSYKEKQELKRKAAMDFHMMVIRVISEHIVKIIELNEFQELDVEKQGIISFGEYMGKSQPICIWDLEKE